MINLYMENNSVFGIIVFLYKYIFVLIITLYTGTFTLTKDSSVAIWKNTVYGVLYVICI